MYAGNIAIDTSTIKVYDHSSATKALPNPIFAKGAPPLWLEIDACEIKWHVEHDLLAEPPKQPKCVKGVQKVRFAPYGSTKVRMTELPVMEGGGEL